MPAEIPPPPEPPENVATLESKDPNVDLVAVDVQAEILKICERQGIHPQRLKERLDLTRAEYYRATVVSFFQGKDEGTRETYAALGQAIDSARRFFWWGVIVWLLGLAGIVTTLVFWLR